MISIACITGLILAYLTRCSQTNATPTVCSADPCESEPKYNSMEMEEYTWKCQEIVEKQTMDEYRYCDAKREMNIKTDEEETWQCEEGVDPTIESLAASPSFTSTSSEWITASAKEKSSSVQTSTGAASDNEVESDPAINAAQNGSIISALLFILAII